MLRIDPSVYRVLVVLRIEPIISRVHNSVEQRAKYIYSVEKYRARSLSLVSAEQKFLYSFSL